MKITQPSPSQPAGVVRNRTTVADTNYVTLASDADIIYTSLTASRAVTLTTTGISIEQNFIIKDESGNAGTFNITITPATGLIDGAANKVINANYGVLRVYFNGTNYFTN